MCNASKMYWYFCISHNIIDNKYYDFVTKNRIDILILDMEKIYCIFNIGRFIFSNHRHARQAELWIIKIVDFLIIYTIIFLLINNK